MNTNAVAIEGNMGGDPDLRYTPNGAAVCNFSVGIGTRVKKNDEWVDGETTWVKVTCWNALAENVAESLSKGDRVIVTGRLQSRSWEAEDGSKRSALDVVADAVAPSLQWATVGEINRTKRSE
jgi:single-strand DNA-binding protein